MATGIAIIVVVLILLYGPLVAVMPELIYAQRQGVAVGVYALFRLKLMRRPLRRLIDACELVQQSGQECRLSQVAACDRPELATPRDLAEEVLADLRERGHKPIDERVEIPVPEAPRYRTPVQHLQMLLGASVMLGVLGFFFWLTGGFTLLSLLVSPAPNWAEVDGTLLHRGHAKRSTYRYQFQYEVQGQTYNGQCTGPFLEDAIRVRYDRNNPQRSHLVGCSDFPFEALFSLFPLALILLLIAPLLMCLGHLFYSSVADVEYAR